MKPSVWGPQFWFILHIISFEYPEYPTESDKNIYYSFYSSLKDILPCEMCKKHYREFIHKHPLMPFLDKKADLIQWVIDIHNQVNIYKHFPLQKVYQEGCASYSFQSNCNNETPVGIVLFHDNV